MYNYEIFVTSIIIILNAIQILLFATAIFKGLLIYRRRSFNKNCFLLVNGIANDEYLPTVSIIKPIITDTAKGKSLIEKYFHIDYPFYDIHFCFQTPNNSCIHFVKQLSEKYPNISVKIHTDHLPNKLGNKKIQNISQACAQAKGEFLWIVDENIHINITSLREMITLFDSEDVGCVHQIPLFKFSDSFAESINMTYFSTHHARFYLFCDTFNILCVAGMSMLFDKQKLKEIGNIESFSKFLSEDYQLINSLKLRGYKIKVSPSSALQDPHESTVDGFLDRMVRWSRLRFNITPSSTLLEPLTHPLVVSFLTSFYIWYYIKWSFLLVFLSLIFAYLSSDTLLQQILVLAFPEQGVLPYMTTRLKAWFFYNMILVPYIYVKFLKTPTKIQWHSNYYNITWGTIILGDNIGCLKNQVKKKLTEKYVKIREVIT